LRSRGGRADQPNGQQGKTATVLYGMKGFIDAEAVLAKPGKYTTGKGCLYIKKLTDVDQKVLEAAPKLFFSKYLWNTTCCALPTHAALTNEYACSQ
jgi:hypothetical protein